MEMKELECHEKDQKLYQVRELIRNSPLAASRSNPNTPFKHKVEKENRTKPGVSTYICTFVLTMYMYMYIHVHFILYMYNITCISHVHVDYTYTVHVHVH